ncbi:MAG: IS1380 family transposase [Acidobacteria bacterium]|nr:IS1380 family transposase [Acidobacteriota bacterium]
MKKSIRDRMRGRNRRLRRRLDQFNYPADLEQPMLRGGHVQFELSGRSVGTTYGGIGLIQQLVRELELAQEIDQRVCLFKLHLPYHESDHVLNPAYNALCDGRCLEDLELRRQDEAYLNLLGAERIPDPTTAGDFCRRFSEHDLAQLHAAFDAVRKKVWARQPAEFFAQARIDAEGTLVATCGECKAGMDYSYKGLWGYHPLIVSLANTGEVLRLINRPGNRPSHEGAAEQFDQCLALCREAGFKKILLRGDTDFSQLRHIDRWQEQQDVRFLFGLDVTALQHIAADDLPDSAWKPLQRPPKYTVQTKPRGRRERIKQQIVERRGFKDIRLVDEWVAERSYRPPGCKHTYRLIIVRKNLAVSEPAQQRLFEDYRYFIYITNDWESTPAEIVFSANDRCQQENLVAQLKGGVRSLAAPVDNLLSNGAYMLMTSLAWNLKAWLALWLPAPKGRWHEQHQAQKQQLLGLEFRTFVNHFLRLPAQIVKTGRRLVVRLLAWNSWQPVFFRLVDQFVRPASSHPLRC